MPLTRIRLRSIPSDNPGAGASAPSSPDPGDGGRYSHPPMHVVSEKTAEYELVLMLDPEVPDERRDGIAAEAMKLIEGGGNLKHDRAWGMRKLAYEIRQRTEADYRFFRFEAEGSLLDDLDHNLKIADGVLRFRVFRVDPESPVIEPPPPAALASAAPGRASGPRRGSEDGTARDEGSEAEPQRASAPQAAAEPAAEPEPAPES